MTAKQIQYAIASVFFILGGWALLLPGSVIELCLRPEYQEGPALAFLIGCFGAQAMIAGLFASTAKFTRATFIAYGWMLLVFFAFDVWFSVVDPVLTPLGGIADGIGNAVMIAGCWLGAKKVE